MTFGELFAALFLGAAAIRNDVCNVAPTVARNDETQSNQTDKHGLPAIVAPSCNDARNHVCNDAAIVAPTVAAQNLITGSLLNREDAVAAFLEAMIGISDPHGEAGGLHLSFAMTKRNYGLMASAGGWPSISDKTFSQLLARMGCKRINPNDAGYPRKRYPARPVLIVFPTDEQYLAARRKP